MSNQAARIGYSYQDKLALLKMLKSFCSKRLDEAYVEYPFNGGKSMDIYLIERERKTAFEVKSGRTFQGQRSGEQLAKAISNLYLFQEEIAEEVKCKIIIRPEAKVQINNHISDIDHIKEFGKNGKNNSGEKGSVIAERWYEECSVFSSVDGFVSFIQEFFEFENGCEYGQNFEKSDLDKKIISEINELSRSLGIEGSNIILTSEIIYFSLLEVVRKGGENGENMVLPVISKVGELLTSRKFIETFTSVGSGVSRDEELTKTKEKIREKIIEKFNFSLNDVSTSSDSLREISENNSIQQ